MSQGYRTYQEYEDLGYVLRDDVRFASGSYQTAGSFDLNPFDWAYRADTKEEYYRDATMAGIEIGLAFVSGGVGRLFRTTYGVVKELVTNE